VDAARLDFSARPEVQQLGLAGRYLVIDGLRNQEADEAFEAYRRQDLARLTESYQGEGFVRDDPVLAGFRELHIRVGRSNRRFVSSPEALVWRLLRTGSLPRLNLLVDIYNLVSVGTRLALGAHDAGRIDGSICLRLTDGTESFHALGAAAPEPVFPGEYAYIDSTDSTNDVICRMEVLQVEKTRIEASTTAAFYIVQGNMNTPPDMIAAATDELAALTLRYCGGEIVQSWTVSALA
jgi:DNA/RNA-binding domain of Phe-tRNA-synthetase-like protein